MKRRRFGTTAFTTATIILILWLGLWRIAYRTAGFDCIDSLEPVDFYPCLRSNERTAKFCLAGGLLVWIAATCLFIRDRKNP